MGAALVVLAFAAWCITMLHDPPVPEPEAPGGRDGSDERTASVAADPTVPGKADTTEAPLVDREAPAITSATDAEPEIVRVRLRGLHPEAPWNAPLQLVRRYESLVAGGSQIGTAKVDASGLASFHLSGWQPTRRDQHGKILGKDANYRPFEHSWSGALDTTREIVVDVHATATLTGRVLDTRGAAVPAARVRAFANHDASLGLDPLGESDTGPDGTWILRVPPDVPLTLVVQPMDLSGTVTLPDRGSGLRAMSDRPHRELLPAARHAIGTVGRPTRLPDLVLPDAATIRGVVRWSDGAPVPGALVSLRDANLATLPVGDGVQVGTLGEGSLVPVAAVETAADGTFALPSVPATSVELVLRRIPGKALVGQPLVVTAQPGQRAEFVVPLPITFRVVHAGTALPEAAVEIEGFTLPPAQVRAGLEEHVIEMPRTLRSGATVVAFDQRRVRGRHERLGSAWTTIGPELAGATIQLETAEGRHPVSIVFDGPIALRSTVVAWQRTDGQTGQETVDREFLSQSLRLFLEPGRYRLRIHERCIDAKAPFLAPIERDVDVAATTRPIRIPVVVGGRLVVHAMDRRGLFVAGTCNVRSADAGIVAGCFETTGEVRRSGQPGELLPGSPNRFAPILPPGDYELHFDFGPLGTRREMVKIRPREISDVRVQL